MALGQQLAALLIKDLKITLRSKKRFFLEILFPCYTLTFVLYNFQSERKPQLIEANFFMIFGNWLPELQVENLTNEQFRQLQDAANAMNNTFQPRPYNTVSPLVIRFEKFSPQTNQFSYFIVETKRKMALYDANVGWIFNQPYKTRYIYDHDQFSMGLHSFAVVQYNVNEVLMSLTGRNTSANKPVFNFLPQATFIHNYFNVFCLKCYKHMAITSLAPMAIIIKDLISETENDIKNYMLITGMTRYSFYFSHYLFGFGKMLLVMFITLLL
ncbi:unnamed protein product [Bursaphelenchus okinawaensis]|uniref:ABC2_membrane domain-containing protein n=1 Tax=Bursaphelenchus okinawaensis TaxID=465554 RepID=A0A811JW19_9BILA|nr:unnamed protein product [Bursaphelenchus okinawaensis]CAG9085024.1 unnamed protein product [Bursaphelenchus okinawaensis]